MTYAQSMLTIPACVVSGVLAMIPVLAWLNCEPPKKTPAEVGVMAAQVMPVRPPRGLAAPAVAARFRGPGSKGVAVDEKLIHPRGRRRLGLQLAPRQNRTARKHVLQDQRVHPSPCDAYSQNLPAAPVGRLVIPPDEGRDLALAVVPPLADQDHTVELLALRLMNGHDLHTGRRVRCCREADCFLVSRRRTR